MLQLVSLTQKSSLIMGLLVVLTACGSPPAPETQTPPATDESAPSNPATAPAAPAPDSPSAGNAPSAAAPGATSPGTTSGNSTETATTAPANAPNPEQPIVSDYFVTPSGKLACDASASDYLRCQIISGGALLNPLPQQPADCNLDWGSGVVLEADEFALMPEVLCAGDTIIRDPNTATTLPYGQTWQSGGFTCSVETVGLTCKNEHLAGFFLSTQQWRPLLAPLFEFDQVRNERFGFTLAAPLPWESRPSQNGDGVTIESPEGDLVMAAWGNRLEDEPGVSSAAPPANLTQLTSQHRQDISQASGVIYTETQVAIPIAGSGQTVTGWQVDYSQQGDRVFETITLHNGIVYRLQQRLPESALDSFHLAVIQTMNENFAISGQ